MTVQPTDDELLARADAEMSTYEAGDSTVPVTLVTAEGLASALRRKGNLITELMSQRDDALRDLGVRFGDVLRLGRERDEVEIKLRGALTLANKAAERRGERIAQLELELAKARKLHPLAGGQPTDDELLARYDELRDRHGSYHTVSQWRELGHDLASALRRANEEVMAHQVGDGYQKGYEHGAFAATKRLERELTKAKAHAAEGEVEGGTDVLVVRADRKE